jgi:hypothetical protein
MYVQVEEKSIFYSILFYSILFYSILFYSILFYSILFYSILFYSILFSSILFYSILFYSILFYSILLYSILFTVQEERSDMRPIRRISAATAARLESKAKIKPLPPGGAGRWSPKRPKMSLSEGHQRRAPPSPPPKKVEETSRSINVRTRIFKLLRSR